MNILIMKTTEKVLNYLEKKECNIIYVSDSWDRENISFLNNKSDKKFREIKVDNLDSLEELSSVYVQLTGENINISKIISGAEYSTFAIGYLKTLFFNDTSYLKQAISARDKRAMKQVFDISNVRHANYVPSFSKEKFFKKISHHLIYPIIVKPVAGTGTFNTQLVNNDYELSEYFNSLKLHPTLVSQEITLEEYIAGEEYHLDILWKNGEAVFSSISQYLTPRINVLNHPELNGSVTIKRDETTESTYSEAIESQKKINQNINLINGVTHSEFIIDKNNQIVFIEFATRYGGFKVPETIKHTYGIDLIVEWINIELGIESQLNTSQSKYVYSCFNLVPKKPGSISIIPNIEEMIKIPWLVEIIDSQIIGNYFSLTNPSEWGLTGIIKGKDVIDVKNKTRYLFEHFPLEVD